MKADMALKEVTLRALSKRAKLPYSSASMILGGHTVDEARLQRLRIALESFPMPKEAAAA